MGNGEANVRNSVSKWREQAESQREAALGSSARLVEVCLRFGVPMTATERPAGVLDRLGLSFRPGTLTLIVGPSGAGKTMLLAEIAQRFPTSRRVNDVQFPLDVAVVDAVAPTRPIGEALGLMTACGLGEPGLWVRRFDQLSDGEQFRARLARAVWLHRRECRGHHCLRAVAHGGWESEKVGRCESEKVEKWESEKVGKWESEPSGSSPAGSADSEVGRYGGGAVPLLCDEFGTNLHRRLAKAIAFNLRKLVTRERLALVVATSHEDVEADLRADRVVRLPIANCGLRRTRRGKPLEAQKRGRVGVQKARLRDGEMGRVGEGARGRVGEGEKEMR